MKITHNPENTNTGLSMNVNEPYDYSINEDDIPEAYLNWGRLEFYYIHEFYNAISFSSADHFSARLDQSYIRAMRSIGDSNA